MRRWPRLSLVLLALAVVLGVSTGALTACADASDLGLSLPDTSPPEEAASTPEPTPTGSLDDVVPTGTSAPTATPDAITEGVEELASRVGVEDFSFLSLSAADWLNLLISIVLTVVIGLLVGGWLTRKFLPGLAERTPTDLDDALVEVSGSDLRWLILVATANFQTRRLTFLSVGIKTLVGDAAFVISLVLVFRILWRSLGVTEQWFRDKSAEEDSEQDVGPLIKLLSQLGHIVLVFGAGSILLSRFGINVSVLAIALGIGGLAVSLASRDIIADFIAGFIIQIDRPFRVGDRIEIQGVGTWGDVVDVGLRSTRIRTRDNRMVIVPNGIIGSNQVVNYTFPDPQYRIETHIGVAYGTDVERTRRIIIDTVRNLEGVLPGKPVDALYIEMGPSSMVFRVRWWIDSYVDTRRMMDRVHTALQGALDDASVEMPYPIQTLQLHMPVTTDQQFPTSSRVPDEGPPGAGVPEG